MAKEKTGQGWHIASIRSVPKFLAAIAEYLPTAHTVSFEIRSPCSEVRTIYRNHHSRFKYRPYRDTVAPRTGLHYCTISPKLADDLQGVLRTHNPRKVFWHIKGFDDEKLLFLIHDADMGGSACLSPHIHRDVIRAIASAIGCKAETLDVRIDWDENFRLSS